MPTPDHDSEKLELERHRLQIEMDKLGVERLKVRIEVWKKTVDVQQHFNDLELRIRNFAVTVLTAVLSITGLAIKERIFVSMDGWRTPLAAWFLGVGVVAWSAFYFMDRWWYHRLLMGSVLEKELEKELPNTMKLGHAISDASPFYLAGWKVRSSQKIDLFYGAIGAILLGAMVILHITLV
jgi:hypothetical protein